MAELCVVTQRSGPLTKVYFTDRFRLVRWAGEQQCRGSPSPLPSMWDSSADKLELYLALFGYRGIHHVLTYDDEHLPQTFDGVKRSFSAFLKRVRRFDPSIRRYIYAIEAGHTHGRWHIHFVADDGDLPTAVVQHLWGNGFVDPGYKDYPVLTHEEGYRRLAEYFCKDGNHMIPLGRHRWGVARGMRQLIPPRTVRVQSRAPGIPRETFWSEAVPLENRRVNGMTTCRVERRSWIVLPPQGTQTFLVPRRSALNLNQGVIDSTSIEGKYL